MTIVWRSKWQSMSGISGEKRVAASQSWWRSTGKCLGVMVTWRR
jgi:hypothetical protein